MLALFYNALRIIQNICTVNFGYINIFKPLLHRLGIDRTPHCCRHTTISMLADAHVDQTTIKKIVGHSGAMSLTERVYTHLDVHELVDAINQI